jgi:hypothetical protein
MINKNKNKNKNKYKYKYKYKKYTSKILKGGNDIAKKAWDILEKKPEINDNDDIYLDLEKFSEVLLHINFGDPIFFTQLVMKAPIVLYANDRKIINELLFFKKIDLLRLLNTKLEKRFGTKIQFTIDDFLETLEDCKFFGQTNYPKLFFLTENIDVKLCTKIYLDFMNKLFVEKSKNRSFITQSNHDFFLNTYPIFLNLLEDTNMLSKIDNSLLEFFIKKTPSIYHNLLNTFIVKNIDRIDFDTFNNCGKTIISYLIEYEYDIINDDLFKIKNNFSLEKIEKFNRIKYENISEYVIDSHGGDYDNNQDLIGLDSARLNITIILIKNFIMQIDNKLSVPFLIRMTVMIFQYLQWFHQI